MLAIFAEDLPDDDLIGELRAVLPPAEA